MGGQRVAAQVYGADGHSVITPQRFTTVVRYIEQAKEEGKLLVTLQSESGHRTALPVSEITLVVEQGKPEGDGEGA